MTIPNNKKFFNQGVFHGDEIKYLGGALPAIQQLQGMQIDWNQIWIYIRVFPKIGIPQNGWWK